MKKLGIKVEMEAMTDSETVSYKICVHLPYFSGPYQISDALQTSLLLQACGKDTEQVSG